MLIYVQAITPRIEYILNYIFKEEFGLNYRVTINKEEFDVYEKEKINYSNKKFAGEFFIKAHSLLLEKSIKKFDVYLEAKHQTIVLFSNDLSCNVGFDIFSAVFYLISRYEEYLPFTPDDHGRYAATSSLAYQNNFLQYPLVNIWLNNFKEALQKKFPSLSFRRSSFNAIATYDIDVAYEFKGRSLFRNIGAITNDALNLKFKNIYRRISTLLNLQKDPWDVYSFLQQKISHHNLKKYFFLFAVR